MKNNSGKKKAFSLKKKTNLGSRLFSMSQTAQRPTSNQANEDLKHEQVQRRNPRPKLPPLPSTKKKRESTRTFSLSNSEHVETKRASNMNAGRKGENEQSLVIQNQQQEEIQMNFDLSTQTPMHWQMNSDIVSNREADTSFDYRKLYMLSHIDDNFESLNKQRQEIRVRYASQERKETSKLFDQVEQDQQSVAKVDKSIVLMKQRQEVKQVRRVQNLIQNSFMEQVNDALDAIKKIDAYQLKSVEQAGNAEPCHREVQEFRNRINAVTPQAIRKEQPFLMRYQSELPKKKRELEKVFQSSHVVMQERQLKNNKIIKSIKHKIRLLNLLRRQRDQQCLSILNQNIKNSESLEKTHIIPQFMTSQVSPAKEIHHRRDSGEEETILVKDVPLLLKKKKPRVNVEYQNVLILPLQDKIQRLQTLKAELDKGNKLLGKDHSIYY